MNKANKLIGRSARKGPARKVRGLSRNGKTALAIAVGSALALLFAMPTGSRAADAPDPNDPAVAALTREANHIEFGGLYQSHDSAKFGEYNGLGKEGFYGNGSFRLNGGGRYDSPDATRWNLRGDNLGLETRELNFDYTNQGKYRFNFGYSELLHRISDTYQTPYLGGARLTLPSTWQKPLVPQANATAINFRALDPVAGTGNCIPGGVCPASGIPSAAQLTQLAGIRNADLPAFHNFDLKTKREAFDASGSLELTRDWQLTAYAKHETKQGNKPRGGTATISTFGWCWKLNSAAKRQTP